MEGLPFCSHRKVIFMPKVQALVNFHDGRKMRSRGEQFEIDDSALNLELELKRVRTLTAARSNTPVTNNRQLEGGVDKTPVLTTDPSDKKPATQVGAMSTETSARELLGSQGAAKRAAGKAATAPPIPAATPAGKPAAKIDSPKTEGGSSQQ